MMIDSNQPYPGPRNPAAYCAGIGVSQRRKKWCESGIVLFVCGPRRVLRNGLILVTLYVSFSKKTLIVDKTCGD